MARVLRMPEVAEDPTEAVLSEWLVAESAAFLGAQSLATVETAKLLVSVEVAEPGVLLKTLVPAGAHVDRGTALAVLGEPGETVADLDSLLADLGLPETPTSGAAPVEDAAPADVAPVPPRHLGATPGEPWKPEDPRITELRTRSVADILGLTPTTAEPPPTAHPVAPRDVSNPWEQHAAPSYASDATRSLIQEVGQVVVPVEPADEAVDLPGLDERPAEQPSDAPATVSIASVAQLHLRATVRVEPLLALHTEINADADEVSLTALVVKAVASTYRRVPLDDSDAGVDVAVAMSTDAGMAAPVVGDVGALTVTALTETLDALAAGARQGGLQPEELQGAAITVVDLGTYGVAEATVEVTSSRTAVLAVGAVRDEPVVEAGAVVAGKVLTVTLSVNEHRIDAVLAARWLAALVSLLQHPVRFLA